MEANSEDRASTQRLEPKPGLSLWRLLQKDLCAGHWGRGAQSRGAYWADPGLSCAPCLRPGPGHPPGHSLNKSWNSLFSRGCPGPGDSRELRAQNPSRL